jgi:hypothetical protein
VVGAKIASPTAAEGPERKNIIHSLFGLRIIIENQLYAAQQRSWAQKICKINGGVFTKTFQAQISCVGTQT